MNDIEVYVDLTGETFLVGLARINRARGNETMVFEYDRAWLESTNRFALEPGLPLMRGGFSPGAGHSLFGSIGDSAPDTWGRRLMQRKASPSEIAQAAVDCGAWKVMRPYLEAMTHTG